MHRIAAPGDYRKFIEINQDYGILAIGNHFQVNLYNLTNFKFINYIKDTRNLKDII